MKQINILIIILIVLSGCSSSQITGNTPIEISQNENTRLAKLDIKEMTCPSCAFGVEYELKQLQGVYRAEVKYPEGTGTVIYDSSRISAEEIAAASTVYPASVVEDIVYSMSE